MKPSHILTTAALALGITAFGGVASAQVHERVVTHTRTTTTVHHEGPARVFHRHRVCRTMWRHHHRVTRCSYR